MSDCRRVVSQIEMLLLLALSSLLPLAYLAFRWKRRRFYALASKIPGHDGLPFLGELHKFSNLQLKDYATKLLSYINPDTKITKGWFGPLFVVATDDADCIHTLLNSPHALHKPSFIYDSFFMDNGLLACNGDSYSRQRRILNRAFTASLVHKFLPTFNAKAQRCVAKMSEKLGRGDFDVFEFVGTCTLETFCCGQLNYDRDLYASNFIKLIEETRPLIMRRVFSPWFNFKPIYRLSSLHRALEKYYKVLISNVEAIKQNHRLSTNQTCRDIAINLLMNPQNGFSDEELRDELITFIFAGYEATAISLSSVLLMLAMHADVQRKVIEEIDEVAGAEVNEELLNSEDLAKITYTEMVIKEALRLFGPGGILSRQATGEMELGGYTIPEGTVFVLSVFGMQRSPRYWGEDAHLFRPERFEPGNIEKIHPHAFATFSGGKRICIGSKYAMNFMKVFLINFFKAYSVDTRLKYDEITIDMIPTLFISQKYMISIAQRQ